MFLVFCLFKKAVQPSSENIPTTNFTQNDFKKGRGTFHRQNIDTTIFKNSLTTNSTQCDFREDSGNFHRQNLDLRVTLFELQ